MTELNKHVAPDGDEQLLEWPGKDNRRFVRAVYRVGDLDRTIKYIFFNLTSNSVFYPSLW